MSNVKLVRYVTGAKSVDGKNGNIKEKLCAYALYNYIITMMTKWKTRAPLL
jgi:hypothetical protein